MQFMGEYNHSIDAKGRLIVPSKFREKLGDSFIVTKGLDGCLWVFASEEWEAFSEKLTSLPVARKDARNFSRFFLAGATEAETDKMGRILIPQVLREYAGLEKDAVLIGAGSRVEIWNKSAWLEVSSFDNVDDLAEQMGEWGFGI
ncbi:MAG: division/cell wall cluster transcriptional repressor MraZ [Parasporobacterium sp.]|nr:division/cell wall cluster transcriptional repressor MraZ [Parasporobacterium sp.]